MIVIVVAREPIRMHAVWRLECMHMMTLDHVVRSLTHLALVMHVLWAHIHHCFMGLRWSKLSNFGLVWIFITQYYSVDWILSLSVFISSRICKLIFFVKHIIVRGSLFLISL